MEPTTPDPNAKKLDKAALVSLSLELGYIIAIPIVIFGLLGKWIDSRFHHNFPWVTLIGIALAIVTTTMWIIKKLQKYIK